MRVSKTKYGLCLGLLVVNVIIYIYQVITGLDLFEPDNDYLIELGANVSQLTLTGDYWRLVTNIFLHADVLHLTLNMFLFVIVGVFSETYLGKTRTLILYLISGIIASFTSAIIISDGISTSSLYSFLSFQPTIKIIISLGASGSIMGLAAANLIYILRKQEDERSVKDKSTLLSTISLIILTLLFSTKFDGDNAAHIGGLLAGGVIGFAFTDKSKSFYKGSIVTLVFLFLMGVILASYRQQITSTEGLYIAADKIRAELAEQDRLKLLEIEKMIANELALTWDPPLIVSLDDARGTLLYRGEYPSRIIASPDKKRFYISNQQQNRIYVVDAITHSVVDVFNNPVNCEKETIPYEKKMVRCVGNLADLAISPDGSRLYVSGLRKKTFSILNANDGSVIHELVLESYPLDIVLSHSGERAYVLSSNHTILVIDLAELKIIKTLALGDKSRGVTRIITQSLVLSEDDSSLYLLYTTAADSHIYAFNTSTLETEFILGDELDDTGDAENLILGRSLAVSADNQQLLLLTHELIEIYDINSRTLKTQITVCQGRNILEGTTLSPDGRWLATVYYKEAIDGVEEQSILQLVDVETRRTLRAYPVNGSGVDLFPDQQLLFTFGYDSAVRQLDFDKSLDINQVIDDVGELLCF